MIVVSGMEKKGDPQYIRFPLSMECEIQKLSEEEGRSKAEMIKVLVAIGLHIKRFHLKDYCSAFGESEENTCYETERFINKKD